jgi:hypothetical protein
MRSQEVWAAGVLAAAAGALGVGTSWSPGAVLLPATLAALVVLARALPQQEGAAAAPARRRTRAR